MPTYKAIASTTVGSGGASSITFSSIPQTYTDLVLLMSARQDANGAASILGRFNSSATGYSTRQLYGYGTTVGSTTAVGGGTTYADFGIQDNSGTTSNTFSNTLVYIPNYAGSNNKSYSVDSVSEDNTSINAFLILNAGLWSNTSAITSLTLTCQNGNFVQYVTAVLYGVKNS